MDTKELSEAIERAVSRLVTTPWLNTEEAARYLGCSPGSLKTWRARGEGPRYHVLNEKSVRYHRDELDLFVRGEAGR